jgi:hypothetical protein
LGFQLSRDDTRALATLTDELLESDAAYFEAGATVEALPGAELAWMEEFQGLSVGAVVQHVGGDLGGLAPDEWLSQVEGAVRRVGSNVTRLYLTAPHPGLEAVLRERGFLEGLELGYLGRPDPDAPPPASRVSLQPVESECDWVAKARVHESWPLAADGHPAPGGTWCTMERRKAEAGYMQPYLIMAGSTVCGTVAVARRTGLDRVKNLVISRDCTGKGFGREAVLALAEAANQSGRPLGALALPGGKGEAIYLHLGFPCVTRQVEWFRRQ